MNDLRKAHPQTAIDRGPLRAALGFEMMLHCRTSQILSVAERRDGRAVPGAAPPTRSCGGSRRATDRRSSASSGRSSLLYPGVDFRSAHYGLRSSDPTARDHALEFLELNVDRDLRKSLVSAPRPDRSRSTSASLPILKRSGGKTPTAGELAAALVECDDPWLKACGLSAVGALGLSEFAEQVEACLDADDELLRESGPRREDALVGRLGLARRRARRPGTRRLRVG